MSENLWRVYQPDELGRDGYPPEWHKLPYDDLGVGVVTERAPGLKHLVREQVGHRCVRCGHPYRNGAHGNGEWSPCDERCTHDGPTRAVISIHGAREPGLIEAQWRILTVHHLDGDKANCRWWNLAALCQRCHLTIQGRVVMARVWPWEHSEWFRPYVAGYYASVYLGEELTRAEVEERLDELLALGRVA